MAALTQDMSAQQTQHAPMRLLIAERTENAAYQFDSLLRDAGIATRLEVIDLPMALEKLPQADMMLCNAALPDLHRLLPRLRSLAPRVPIILVNNEETALTQWEGMELGAADVVSENEARHLVHVVKRELEHVCQNIQLKQMRKALGEAEQRCQLLLQSSRAAIAYVHEGMHIYANEGYLTLFGFEDADELLGLPLIDLLEGDSASLLKAKMKRFRHDEAETAFDFVGRSTDGKSVNGNMTLAAADYEGEHCLQITVRVKAPAIALAPTTSPRHTVEKAAEAERVIDPVTRGDDDVPVLNDEAIVEPSTGNGTDRTVDSSLVDDDVADEVAQVPGAIEFELELEDNDVSRNDATTNGGHSRDQTDDDVEPVELDLVEFAGAEEEAQEEPAADELADLSIDDDATGEEASDVDEVVEPAPATPNGRSNLALPEFLAESEQIAAAHRGGFISIFVARIDGYEDLQRSFGLAGVDDACRQVEAHLQSIVAGPFMQISPHQWAMLICDKTRENALNQVDGYRRSVEALMFEVREKTVRPTCTFGGAILNAEAHDSIASALEATLDCAFTTLRTTLDSSEGNTVQLPHFDSTDQRLGDEANRILSLIAEAIENQSFTILFQPIISLRGDSDEHYEVFLRMHDRNGDKMAPGEFLRTAIDNGVAGKIDRWVILQSIKMLSAHRSNGHNTRLTINLTSNSVADPEFIQWLGVAIKAARMPSDAVIFQITERDAATYIRQTREFVEGLKNLHCRSSLSRFGLSNEPFELLGHIPVDFVKLDGSMVEDLDKDPERKAEVTNMIRELQNVGKLTIVPMVESASLLSTLWQAGVNYIQGHYLQEPTAKMDYDFSTDD